MALLQKGGVQMPAKPESVERYVRETLHTPLHLAKWGTQNLPALLRHEYDFFTGRLGGSDTLFAFVQQSSTPAAVAKHTRMLGRHWSGNIVIVAEHINSTWRNRMIEKAVPFVVPGRHAYLPMLGIDLRERYKQTEPQDGGGLLPATQVVLLHILLANDGTAHTPTALSETLGYSKMTVSRAFDQLDRHGLASIMRVGRKRLLTLGSERKEVWTRAQPVLRSPVKRRVWIPATSASDVKGLTAGVTALAEMTILAPPPYLTLATTKQEMGNLPTGAVTRYQPRDYVDSDQTQLEIWSYAPWLIASGPRVDHLSLYLSMRDDPDERVQAALSEAMEELAW